MTEQLVLYAVENNIATITLNRPHVKNALNTPMHEALYQAFMDAHADDEVKVIILTGSGDSFCSGADLKSFAEEDLGNVDYGHYLRETYNKLILQIASMNKPIIAYINGVAVGAGLSIALACDYRVAEYDAKFALSFLKIGLVPDAGASYFLPRLVGLGKALELGLGDVLSAEEAFRIGLINRIGKPNDIVEQLLSLPAEAFGLMKKNMYDSYEHSLAEVLEMEVAAQRLAGETEEHKQRVLHFLTKTSK